MQSHQQIAVKHKFLLLKYNSQPRVSAHIDPYSGCTKLYAEKSFFSVYNVYSQKMAGCESKHVAVIAS